ncbi:MAG: Lipid A biosynthesis lauroyltransferase [Phycisphaerae bacterium]|nr:Lipid A biosynthesis lauroyltransferase [Phycisphaerae bacterium]
MARLMNCDSTGMPRAQAEGVRVRPAVSGDASVREVGWYATLKFEVARWFLLGLARLLGLRGLYLFGRFFGSVEYAINFRRRQRYMQSLQRVFPEGISVARQKRITRGYFARTRCDKIFYLICDRLPREKVMRRVRFHGRQYLDDALARQRGVYVMLSHNGSHHVAGLLMALLGYKVAGIRDRNEGAIRQYVQQKYAETFPEFAAVKVLFADAFPREIFRCFQENRVLGSALDVGRIRGMALKTCGVQFFGQRREFLTGTLQIALRCRAAIVQGFVVSRPNFYFRLIVKPPLLVPDDDRAYETDECVAELMQRYADGIEAHIKEYPDHLSRLISDGPDETDLDISPSERRAALLPGGTGAGT